MTTPLRRDLTPAAGRRAPSKASTSCAHCRRHSPGTGLIGIDPVMAVSAPVALSRAIRTITRTLVRACGGAFDLERGLAGGVVARIALPATLSKSASS